MVTATTSLDRPKTSKPTREPLRVSFPGGMAIDAEYRGFTIRTDQDTAHGGAGAAPPPFDLFLASVATCAGYYALQFLRSRNLSTAGLGLSLEPLRDDASRRIGTLRLHVELPEEFPDKYRRALARSIDQCAVKRHIVDPPSFELTLG